jgi:pyruvate/2-oxoglutarate dehydrogenase complex dihydrolipoamide acyltransferase (E2) component
MLAKHSDDNMPVSIDNESFEVVPTPSRIDLKTIDDIRLEMARVYREMRTNQIEAQQGTRLVYVLSAIGKLIELHEFEKRIELLEVKNNGKH